MSDVVSSISLVNLGLTFMPASFCMIFEFICIAPMIE